MCCSIHITPRAKNKKLERSKLKLRKKSPKNSLTSLKLIEIPIMRYSREREIKTQFRLVMPTWIYTTNQKCMRREIDPQMKLNGRNKLSHAGSNLIHPSKKILLDLTKVASFRLRVWISTMLDNRRQEKTKTSIRRWPREAITVVLMEWDKLEKNTTVEMSIQAIIASREVRSMSLSQAFQVSNSLGKDLQRKTHNMGSQLT